MNNYSWSQQLLHRLALSSSFVREAAFDIEQKFNIVDPRVKTANHVFVAGLARSGTTVLMRELYETDHFSSLTYRDMPFVMAPNLWAKLGSGNRQESTWVERAHGDGLMVNYESPEAFEEVFWRTFEETTGPNGVQEFGLTDDETFGKFLKFVASVTRKYGHQRYLSKNNSNVFRIKAIQSIFSNAIFLIPFRLPLQHAGSLLAQHRRFNEIQQNDRFVKQYMAWLGHDEFGLNYRPFIPKNGELEFQDQNQMDHWLEQWSLVYGYVLHAYNEVSDRVMLVCYEVLCEENGNLWRRILEKTNLPQHVTNNFSLKARSVVRDCDEKLLRKCGGIYDELNSRAQVC